MKPPSRPRSAPARYGLGPPDRGWSEREKRCLLKALRAQPQGPLRPELLKKYVRSRDESEILAFVNLLKERVASEAVKAQYWYRHHKQKGAPIPAPIEVWTELAEKLTSCLDVPTTAAFSQVLTIASAEPLSLLHSIPPKPVETKTTRCSSSVICTESGKPNEESRAATISSNAEELAPVEQDGFHVDFERIYKYLSAISRGSKVPELSPGESAVLLDLLMSLPEELGFLDFKKLKSHMHKCYVDLNAYYMGEKSKMHTASSQSANSSREPHDPSLNVHGVTSCLPQQQEGPSSKDVIKPASTTDWRTLGTCPLNTFLLPLDILLQKRGSLDSEN